MKYLLDTDILTLLYAGDARLANRRTILESGAVAISIITYIELLRGRFDAILKAADANQLLQAQQRLQRTEQRLAQTTIVPFEQMAGNEFDRLRQQKKLRKIGRADLLIASIALAHRAILVTRNVRHFRQVPGLQIENWVA